MTDAPDFEGFARDILEGWPVRDIDAGDLFDAALRNGMIREIPGGYDPEQHIDAEGICPETGDPWYEYAFGSTRADAPAQNVRVKPLEWSEIREPNEQIRYDHIVAESVLGLWSIEWKSWKKHDDYTIFLAGDFVMSGGGDLEAAKAAAQADYEARIRSALEPADPLDDAYAAQAALDEFLAKGGKPMAQVKAEISKGDPMDHPKVKALVRAAIEVRDDCIARADKNGVVPIGRSAWDQLTAALAALEYK